MSPSPARWLLVATLAGCESAPVVIAPDAATFDAPPFDRLPAADAPAPDAPASDAPAPDDAPSLDAPSRDVPACGAGQSLCGGRCLDTLADPTHCGACDARCPATTPACVCGACFGSCGPGFLTCCRSAAGTGAVCADPRANNEHCGRCSNRCAAGDRCVDGACEPSLADCDPAHTTCDARPPTCRMGQYASVRVGCWGPCVPFERCLPLPCPDGAPCPHGWRCVASILTCQP